jgi:transcriptional regulator with XRE-family HTH domain
MDDMANKIEPFYEALGSKIQKTREQRKMTQAQLGLSLNRPSTRASIANIESGKQRVLVHTLVQFARAMDVDIQELIPAADQPAQAANPKDVERELRRKLNLGAPQLKKLAVAARPSSPGARNRK